jgi:hypothetical protein
VEGPRELRCRGGRELLRLVFFAFIVLADLGWILKGEEGVQTQNILKNYVSFMQTGLEPKDPRQSRL